MNRYFQKMLILGAIVVLLFVGIIVFSLGIFSPKTTSPTLPIVSPTQSVVIPSQVQNESALKITSVTPVDGATGIAVTTPVTIVMSHSFASGDIVFAINPSFLYDESITATTLIITPKSPLQSGTTYTYAIKIKSASTPSSAYSFTTAGVSNGYTPDTQPKTNSIVQ